LVINYYSDACCREVMEKTDHITQLECDLSACKSDIDVESRKARAVQEEGAVLREEVQSLQGEVRTLQEKSFGMESGECLGEVIEKDMSDHTNAPRSQIDDLSAQLAALNAKKDADDLQHAAEMENCRMWLQQLEQKLEMLRKEVAHQSDMMADLQSHRARQKQTKKPLSDICNVQ